MTAQDLGKNPSPGASAPALGSEHQRYMDKPVESDREKSRLGLKPYFANQKDQLATQLNETARALQKTGSDLSENRSAELVKLSAEKIGTLGGYLESHDFDEMMAGLKHYAQSRPWMVMGGAFLIGLAAARFLKASGRSGTHHERQFPGGYPGV